jgi:hypothetical protein
MTSAGPQGRQQQFGFADKQPQGERAMKTLLSKAHHACVPAVITGFLALALAGCGGTGAGETSSAEDAGAAPPLQEAAEAPAEGVSIDNEGQVPFYARFGGDEMFDDGDLTVIIFYRPPDCIPADFNLMQFFDMPGEESPGAMGCNPPTMDGMETWAGEPGSGPAPLVATMNGNGDVPVWFVENAELDAAIEDGSITIGELSALASLVKGSAADYEELLHPSQSNEVPVVRFSAAGALDDGRAFTVAADYEGGVGDTTITIE